MKTVINAVVLMLLTFSISCKEKEVVKNQDLPQKIDKDAASKGNTRIDCYMYAKNKDTIKLMMRENETIVTGKMVLNLFEKDISQGSFKGVMRGDTLYANYDFESEGTTSTRELVFLKKGTTLLPGYGEVEVDAQNTTTFKDIAKITFDEQFPLTPVACDKINF